MAEEILDNVLIDDPGKPKKILPDQHRAKLDSIVQQMIRNKESDNDIQTVVNDFKSKYSSTQQIPTPPQPAFNIDISQPTFKSAPDKIAQQQFDYSGTIAPKITKLQGLHGQAIEAADKLNKEIESNKTALGRVVAYDRLKEQEKRRQAGIYSPQIEDPLFITDEDLNKINTEAKGDRGRANQVLSAAMEINPEKQKEISKNLYSIDVFNNAANDPNGENRVKKIEENIKGIEKGELIYNHNKQILARPQGFFGSLVSGRNELNRLSDAYDATKKMEDNGNEAGIIQELNERLKNSDPDNPINMPSGILGEIGGGIGGMPIKGMVAGAVASVGTTLSGNPEGSPEAFHLASAAVNARDMYKIGYQNSLEQNYAKFKNEHPDMPDYDAFKKAQNLADNQAMADAASAAAMQYFGGKVGFGAAKQLSKGISGALTQLGDNLGKKAFEAAGIGGIGAGTQAIKNIMAQKAGLKVETGERTKEAFDSGLLVTGAMSILGLANEYLKPSTKNKLITGLGKAPENVVEEGLNRLQQTGTLTPEQSENVKNIINEQRILEASIPDNLPETDRLKVGAKIKERSALKQKLENVDEAYHPEIKEQIKKLNEDILSISKGSERGELQTLINKEINKGNVHGATIDVLRNATEKELEGHMKDISEQAHDPTTAQATIDAFGEEIANKAKELYPEIKEPEIKTEEPIQSSENIIGFKTSKGSEYAIENGKTTRNKAERSEHPGDSGLKEQSLGTVYLTPEESAKADIIYTEGVKSRQINKVGDEVHIIDELENGEKRTTKIKYSNNPEIGLQPFEVFKDGGAHLGNKITELLKSEENAIPIRSSEEIHVGEAPTNSEEVVGGTSESGEIANAQEGASIQPEEGSTASQEKVGIHAEYPPTQISFKGLQEVANEFGYDDVKSRDRVSDIQERKNAEITSNEWAQKGEYQKNIDDLLNRIEKREHVPTAKQRLILEQYLANERQKLREMPKMSPEYDAQLNKIRYIKEVGQIARQEAGAALRLPNEGTLPHPIVDEDSAMIAKMEANAVDQLTDQQKKDVLEQVEKYKQANDEANAKIAQLEEQVAKLDAEKEFKKAKTGSRKAIKTSEERVAYRKSEIEAAREALRKLRSGESGLSAVPLPGIRELIAIAPHVKNIMVDLIEQGATELNDAIKKLHNEFKDVLEGITEKDIHDIIAGEYNEKKEPLSELQKKVQDMKYEAKLITQLDALEHGIPSKNEKALRERNQKIKQLKDQIKDKLKQYEEELPDYEKRLKAIKSRNERKIKEIEEKIKKGNFEKSEKPKNIFNREDVKKQFPKLRDQALDAIARKEEVQHKYDLALFEDEKSRWSNFKKFGIFLGKLVHTSKSFVAGIDDSATFVQNGLAMLANPKVGAKVFLKHWKEAFNERKFKRELAAIHASDDYPIIKASGLDIIEQVSDAAEKAEEAFEQNLLAGKIKINGKEYQPWKYTGGVFERAFASMGNNMRVDLFRKRMAQLLAEEKTFETHPQEYKDAARVINEMTGRGKQNKYIEQASPFITPFIWAPRMLASTFNLLGVTDVVSLVGKKIGTEGYYRKLTPAQRNFALAQVGRGVAMGVAIMGAAALGGAKVDTDPFSVTFGDVIWGNHHYNVFGRFMPIVKTLIQATSGRRDSKERLQDLDNPKFGGKTRLGVVEGFVRGKVTPFAGTSMNLIEGRDYFTNQKFGWGDVPGALLEPMSIKDLTQGWHNDGTMGLLNRFIPAFEGLKVTDERDFQKEEGSGGGAGASGHYGKSGKLNKHSKYKKN